jgi:hypothetical protein
MLAQIRLQRNTEHRIEGAEYAEHVRMALVSIAEMKLEDFQIFEHRKFFQSVRNFQL